MNLEEISTSLVDVRKTLEASGFDLELDAPDEQKLTVTVRPGPDACPECLVPKSMFKSIVSDSIGANAPKVVVRYPVDLD